MPPLSIVTHTGMYLQQKREGKNVMPFHVGSKCMTVNTKKTCLHNPAVYPVHWHTAHLNLLDVDTILCPVLCPLCVPDFPVSVCVCSVVAFQVTLVHRGEHSFLLKSPVWSSEHTDCVQLTATTAGFSILAAQTTLLLHGSWDNDRKASRKPFPRVWRYRQRDTRSYENSQNLCSTCYSWDGLDGYIWFLSHISYTLSNRHWYQTISIFIHFGIKMFLTINY